ncbi:MAG: DUF1667 domain-containing protein [Clostridia bacterium]|nr:DUF1667 domain-containing protein [Clostridia bacterium]
MKILETTCIRCPVGCHLRVEKNGENISVEGNRCPRGAEYGKQEMTAPMRTITTILKRKNGGTLAVRTSRAIPKEKYFAVLDAIHSCVEPKNPKFGDILIENVCDTEANIIITEVN